MGPRLRVIIIKYLPKLKMILDSMSPFLCIVGDQILMEKIVYLARFFEIYPKLKDIT